MTPIEAWWEQMRGKESPVILLTGAKPWPGSVQLNHKGNCRHGRWIGTDIFEGDGVELVGDLHHLHSQTDQRFDGVFCPATLEHLERPWLAVDSMAQLLNPGGCIYIQTHQTFPLHGYPQDFFRFSIEALNVLCADAGLTVIASGYEFPCAIRPRERMEAWNTAAKSYLNVSICGVKP